jgi:HEAT repeat protein
MLWWHVWRLTSGRPDARIHAIRKIVSSARVRENTQLWQEVRAKKDRAGATSPGSEDPLDRLLKLAGAGRPRSHVVLRLADGDANVRAAAVEGLASLGPGVLWSLLELLETSMEGAFLLVAEKVGQSAQDALLPALEQGELVGSAAIRFLGAIGDDRIMAPLVASLNRSRRRVDTHLETKRILVKKFGEAAIPALADLLTHSDDQATRRAIVDCLAAIGGPAVVPALLGALRDPETSVRHEVIRALGEVGDPRACEPLLEVLTTTDMQGSVAIALGRIRDRRAVAPLAQLAVTCAASPYGSITETLVIGALGSLGGAEALSVLERLNGRDKATKDALASAIQTIRGESDPASQARVYPFPSVPRDSDEPM